MIGVFGGTSTQMLPQLPLLRFRHPAVHVVLVGLWAACPFPTWANTPCDKSATAEPDDEPWAQVGVRVENRPGACTYLYTVLSRYPDRIAGLQIGYDIATGACELTGARPHVLPETVGSPPGWESTPAQSEHDSTTFAVYWRVTPELLDSASIATNEMLSGFSVTLPRPDPLYENCHWTLRFRWNQDILGYGGSLRPEGALTPGSGTISGRVVNERGSGVPFAAVVVKRTRQSVASGPDGTYLISGVPAGSHTLAVSALGYNPCQAARVRVAKDNETTADLRLAVWPLPQTPCAPYYSARDRLALPFPGDVVDTLGAFYLDARTAVPPRRADDASPQRAFIRSFGSQGVDLIYRGIRGDTATTAFTASVHRYVRDANEERLLRIAEETYPPPDAILAIAGKDASKQDLRKEKRLWWYGQFDGVRLPYAVTMDAVRYYLALIQTMARGDSSGIPMKRAKFSYTASVSSRPSTLSRDGRVFEDVYTVELRLSWSDYCGSLCACSFDLNRTVVLRADGTVLCVFGDQKPMVIVS
jgi:carboxypeptidase family protein